MSKEAENLHIALTSLRARAESVEAWVRELESRLRGAVHAVQDAAETNERLTSRAESAEARVKELECAEAELNLENGRLRERLDTILTITRRGKRITALESQLAAERKSFKERAEAGQAAYNEERVARDWLARKKAELESQLTAARSNSAQLSEELRAVGEELAAVREEQAGIAELFAAVGCPVGPGPTSKRESLAHIGSELLRHREESNLEAKVREVLGDRFPHVRIMRWQSDWSVEWRRDKLGDWPPHFANAETIPALLRAILEVEAKLDTGAIVR